MSIESRSLNVEIFKMPEIVEPSAITTAGAYILTSHLVRPLTKTDKFGAIQGDLAKSWFSSPDKKTWTVEVVDATFSNGDPLTVDDVIRTIRRQINLKTGVHFPFNEVKSLEKKNSRSFEIHLEHPRNDFIYDLSKPEFGILHQTDADAGKGECKFTITSGPYRIGSRDGDKYFLKRNPNHTSESGNTRDVVMASSAGNDSAKEIAASKIDFFTTQQSLTLAEHRMLLEGNPKVKAIKPHVGFSFWLSLNSDSPIFKHAENRAALQVLIHDYKSPVVDDFFWEKASQLYLPDGDGRPSSEELEVVWNLIKSKAAKSSLLTKKQKLRVLPLKIDNALTTDILTHLGRFFDVEVIKYQTENELSDRIRDGLFDIKLSSNDFSSTDLSENLKTTFNASRPYVFLGKFDKIRDLLKHVSEIDDRKARSELFKKIATSLLSDGLIAPIAYLRVFFYLNKTLDISSWSTLFPEISLWKMKVNDRGI